MNRAVSRIVVATVVLCCAVWNSERALAQDEVDPALTEFLDTFDKTINQLVNSATLFSAQDTISSGYFVAKSDVDPDSKLDILKIPVRYSLADNAEAEIRPFVLGHVGRFKFREVIPQDPEALGRDDFSVIESWTFQGGGGVDFVVLDGLTVTPQFSLAYTRLENRFDYNNDISQQLGELVDGVVFNWNIDTLTYAPRIGAAYELPFDSVSLKLLSNFTYLYNDSIHSSSSLVDVSSDTSMFQNGLKARVPLGVQFLGGEVALDPYVLRSDIQGAARDGLGFDHFYEGGMDVALGTSESIGVISELTGGYSYTWADSFEGIRVGLGASF